MSRRFTSVFSRSLRSLLALAALGGAGWSCDASGASTERAPVHVADTDAAVIPAFDTLSVRHVVDSARPRARAAVVAPRAPRLSPLADSIGQLLVFLSKTQRAYIAASRANHLLLDIGRVDTTVKTPERLRAFTEAVKAMSPVRIGDRFRLHGPWGADDAIIEGYEQWNGRIVATMQVPPRVDSLAHRKEPLIAFALRADSAAPAVTDSCRRDSVNATLGARLPIVRDSLAGVLKADTAKLTARLMKSLRATRTEATGCFGPGRVLMFIAQSAGDYEYYHELAVLVDTAGAVTPLKVNDLRFKIHEALRALDADGDGIDDIALRGHAPRIGGTVILRLDPAKKRLDYLGGGFAWETY